MSSDSGVRPGGAGRQLAPALETAEIRGKRPERVVAHAFAGETRKCGDVVMVSSSASRSNGRTASSSSARPQDRILADCHRTVSFYHMNVVPIGDFLPTVIHAYAKAAARRSSTAESHTVFRNGQREFAAPLVGRIPPAVRRCAVVRAGAQERLSTIAQCEQQLADLPVPGNHAGALDRRLPYASTRASSQRQG